MIYFIKSPDGPIKIGTTIRLSQRLKQLVAYYGEGLEVLAVVEGNRSVERDLYDRFSHLRTVGEWFEPGDDLVGFIVAKGKPWDGEDEESSTGLKLTLPDDFHDRLWLLARQRKTSVSAVATEILDRNLPRFTVSREG